MLTAEREVDNKREEIYFALSNFGINRDEVLFLNEKDPTEPWLSSDQLMSIARQAGGFKTTSIQFDKYVEERGQVIYTALVVDDFDRTCSRSGVATEGENTLIDADTLAQARALKAALTGAGFNPFKAGSLVTIENKYAGQQLPQNQIVSHESIDEATLRVKDLKQINAIATAKRLKVYKGGGRDDSAYRTWLSENFGVNSAADADRSLRAQIINALELYDPLSRPDLSEEDLHALA